MSAGTEKHIVTEQGGITVKIPAGVNPGKRIRVKGKGRLDTSTQQQGDLYLLIVQRSLTKEEQQVEAERQQNEQRKQDQERQRQERLKREETEKQQQAEKEERQRWEAEQLRQQQAAEATSLKQQKLKGNYTQLEALLKAGKWKEADQETAKCMWEVMGRQKEGWLRKKDVEDFPCEDLSTIDQLWVKYSKGRFGFSVQKQIWQRCGSPTDISDVLAFAVKMGWRREQGLQSLKKMHELTDDISAPTGQFPYYAVVYAPAVAVRKTRDYLFDGGWAEWNTNSSANVIVSLANRLANCNIQ